MSSLEHLLIDSICRVECNSASMQLLWEKYSNVYNWETKLPSFVKVIGYLNRRPITLSITFATIQGKLIAFWEPTSELIDHAMIEKWFFTFYGKVTPENSIDDNNFFNVINLVMRDEK